MDSLLSDAERRTLLSLARRSIETRLQSGQALVQRPPGDVYQRCYGAFVTLHRGKALRGCLGYIEPRGPLAEQIIELAWMAAHQDHRFQPVVLGELPALHIEISVLSPVRPVESVETLLVGRDGLIVSQGTKRGLLLPQVASERGWDVPTFLEQTCLKAGLPRDAWRHGAQIEAFSCEVFGEPHEQDSPPAAPA